MLADKNPQQRGNQGMRTITVRRLTSADLDAATALMAPAFGPAPWQEVVRRHLGLQPEGLLLAERAGQTLGMVSGLDYGPFAYIGMLAVHPAAQRQGVARALMSAMLAWLDSRGCPVALLDATADGAPLYAQLGFADVAPSAVVARADAPTPAPLPADIERLAPTDLDALVAFDAPIFGADRRALLAQLLATLPGRVLATRDAAGAVSGYLVAQAQVLGPWAAQTPAVAELLLRAALTCSFAQPPRVLVPGGNPAALTLLAPYGFRVQWGLCHMQRGPRVSPGDRALLYSHLSFALG